MRPSMSEARRLHVFGKIIPMDSRDRAICKLCWAGIGMFSLFMSAGLILAMTP